ncbi:MAG: type II 3-dehydroquinate dehydratase [Lachnospiraceae bacterium]|nr:type II 3-dehydroquinate dehydratase [Lachnospiraceae bacterium]
MKLLVINGPNLNFLGIREPGLYGKVDYDQLCQIIMKRCAELNIVCDIFQSNHEGAIIDKIQEAYHKGIAGIVMNPGAYGHYSYAIHDAITSVSIPTVEVHITDIKSRKEEWRHKTVIEDACVKTIIGHGLDGYTEGIDFLIDYIKNGNK